MTQTTMTTQDAAHGQDACYFGECGHWLIAATVTRDCDALGRSNFDAMLKLLGGESDTVQIERSSHWACGWIDRIIIDPANTHAVSVAEAARAELADYPVLDEDLYSEYETDEANEVWESCYSDKERVKWLREHEGDTYVRSLAGLFAAARGRWFPGNASDILS